MLPLCLKPINFGSWEQEAWEDYRDRLSLPADEAVLEFYRQVVYDHFDHFNEHYPQLDLDDYALSIEYVTAQEASESIRYFHNQPMTEWGWQYDQFKSRNQNYMIYQRMAKDLTPPFPPVVVATESLADDGWRVYGRDLHLIEGTHRLSYLGRMLELGEILPTSLHKFVLLRPRLSSSDD
ncbi:hypothetical protein FHW69_002817 [Luteibacter sp. Sphag1AF]|uniref:hypothetical protein n=1 Tax=Luteibacter sp. Sphag1AF TaxID=2587031 RepID=UPI00160B233F|nr:hypothetical protein [Luteibacter sp. Sphag1AF]MBB3228182.1 hypothetical protein [Luteibacter sp. Sphag1AF]